MKTKGRQVFKTTEAYVVAVSLNEHPFIVFAESGLIISADCSRELLEGLKVKPAEKILIRVEVLGS